jgi:gluconate 2-dehydrogenase gamma chain
MKRRDLFRNTVISAIGAAAMNSRAIAREFPPGYDASVELARADWKPVFLDDHQNETLIVLSDMIIPATDTPGAKAALVNRFLDLLMSSETAEAQRAFLTSLAYIDGAALARYKAVFLHLTSEQRTDFLNLLAYPHSQARWGEHEPDFPGYDHFSRLKGWIASAFYSSADGLKELGWDGSFPHGVFSGCDHSVPGSHTHSEKE